ncbi:hypothetical protein WJX84_008400 [Apatococcus fuscideae]|uniref:Uncharacterized protein n=1 Tax=Apatococcus fuscideae TaxID=2026836 RepID=A0AAW1T396_9CHLO
MNLGVLVREGRLLCRSSETPRSLPTKAAGCLRKHASRQLAQRCQHVCSATAAAADTAEELDEAGSPDREVEDFRSDRTHDADYVVIGSGIGGLCCAALLASSYECVCLLSLVFQPALQQ